MRVHTLVPSLSWQHDRANKIAFLTGVAATRCSSSISECLEAYIARRHVNQLVPHSRPAAVAPHSPAALPVLPDMKRKRPSPAPPLRGGGRDFWPGRGGWYGRGGGARGRAAARSSPREVAYALPIPRDCIRHGAWWKDQIEDHMDGFAASWSP